MSFVFFIKARIVRESFHKWELHSQRTGEEGGASSSLFVAITSSDFRSSDETTASSSLEIFWLGFCFDLLLDC